MGKRLMFDDIDEWTPSSISIVDEPSHPLCHFEVYEDDEDYVKKSIELNEYGEMMVDQNQQTIEEPKVEVSESFLERILNRAVGKSVEEPPKEEEVKTSDLEARIAALEAKVEKLENAEEPKEEKETVPGAVTKSEGEAAEGETSEEGETEEETTPEDEEEIVDEEEVVVKSKSIDPDTVSTSVPEKSLVERAGRNTNGMTW